MSRSFLASTKLVSWFGLCLLLPVSLLQFRGLAWLSAILLGGVEYAPWHSLRLLPVAVCFVLCCCCAWRSLQPPQFWSTRLMLLSGLALLFTVGLLYGTKVWLPKFVTIESVVVFLITGLLAEELWCRGLIYTLTDNSVGQSSYQFLSLSSSSIVAILVSAVAFGMMHWQYHHYQITWPAFMQITYTTMMGIFLGYLRAKTHSLWPCVAVHMGINLIALSKTL